MPRPQITEWTRWIFASGGVCTGVVLVNAQYLLLIYYSQVLGLSASLAGLAMAIALVFDAGPAGLWSEKSAVHLARVGEALVA